VPKEKINWMVHFVGKEALWGSLREIVEEIEFCRDFSEMYGED